MTAGFLQAWGDMLNAVRNGRLKSTLRTIFKIKKLWHKAENYAKIYLENINGD